MDFIPANVRSWIYGIATAVAALLGVYGIIDDSQLPVWLGLIAAILGTGTATIYRPTRKSGTTATTGETEDAQ